MANEPSAKQKIALITGVTGQDGAILAEQLLEKNYIVHGVRAYSAVPDMERIEHLGDLNLHYGDLTDGGSVFRLVSNIIPDEIYNMAGMSHVKVSFDTPEYAANVNALGPLRILEAIRALGLGQHVRFYQASSSEMFGRSPAPQDETTPMEPCSPYGVAKLHAYWTVKNYREAYGMHASNGILFNHEGPTRGEGFVTRKICKAVADIEAGKREYIELGYLDAKRDWGHARDYMEAVQAIVHHDKPDDYVVATGETHSVREFVTKAFAHIGMALMWFGEGVEEQAMDKHSGQVVVKINPELYRPQEIVALCGNPAKAFQKLGWAPQTSFDELIAEMMGAERFDARPQDAKARHG
jgi:GDPmannose 4,6-dehydratase